MTMATQRWRRSLHSSSSGAPHLACQLGQGSPRAAGRRPRGTRGPGRSRAGAPARAAIAARIQAAKFVQVQTVDTFDFEYNGSTRKLRSRYLNLLATDLVAEGIGHCLLGPRPREDASRPCAGLRPVPARHRVLFTTLTDLINRLSAAEATRSLHHALQTFQRRGSC